MKILDEELHISHAGPKQVIAAASQAWKEMFPSDTSGRPIANRGIIRGFSEAGLVPFDRHAIGDLVFQPAEALGRAYAAARAKISIPDPSPADAHALIDKVAPLVLAAPVDLEKAAQVARRSRKKVSTILTGAQVRQRAAAAILAEDDRKAGIASRRAARQAKNAKRDADKAAAAIARAALAAAKATKPAAKKRPRQPAAATKTDAAAGDGLVAMPDAGLKRRAEAPVQVADAGGTDAAPQAKQKRVRLVCHKAE